MSPGLTVLTCEKLRRETAAALSAAGLGSVEVVSVPAACDPKPAERAALARAVAARVEERGPCCLLGGGCLDRLELPVAAAASLLTVREETCFHLFANRGLVDGWIAQGAHLVTPGWLARWRQELSRWGLDRETAADLFREGATRLLLLDTGVAEGAAGQLHELAGHVGLPWGVAPVGLDHYRGVLLEAVHEARATLPGCESDPLRRRLADGEAVLDFAERLAGASSEEEVVGRLLALCRSLLAPERLVYLAVEGGEPGRPRVEPEGGPPPGELLRELRGFRGDAALAADGRALLFRIADPRETLGLGAVEGVAFPRYRERYLELLRTLARAAAITLGTARALSRAARAEALQREEREKAERQLREAVAEARTLRGLLPICASCKCIRSGDGSWASIEAYVAARTDASFSHGLCPACCRRLYPELDLPEAEP